MVTVEDVKAYLGIDAVDTFDDVSIQDSVNAARAHLDKILPLRDWDHPDAAERRGMVMLAAQMYERRGATGAGQNAGYEFSGQVPLIGADIARLLGIDRFADPVIA